MSVIFDARCIDSRNPTGVSVYAHTLLHHLASAMTPEEFIVFSNNAARQNNKDSDSYTRIHTRIPNKLLHARIALFQKPTLESLISRRHGLQGATTFIAPNLHFIALAPATNFVLVCHDLSFAHFSYFYSPKMRLWHTCIAPQKLFNRATHIIAVSHATADDVIATYKIAPKKLHVAHPGLPPLPDSLPALKDLPERYILCISSIEPRKNITTLIAAFSELIKNPAYRDLHLILIGPKRYKGSELLRNAKTYNLGDKFHYAGYVPAAVKYGLLKRAAAFVYPSFFEGFGFPPLEAMRMGIPVIASATPSLQEVLGNTALLANPYRQSEFTLAMDALLSDESLWRYFSELGRLHAQKYTWSETVDMLKQLIT